MSKLDELRNLGYDLTLLRNNDIDIQLPQGQDLTPKLETRLQEIKPLLLEDLIAEQDSNNGLYRFVSYSTRKDMRGKGRLVMELISNDTGELTLAYFNVNITYQRGTNKGGYFKTGRNGRFWVFPGSKFATFWIQTMGQPEKWSTLYRQMGHLKLQYFSGEIKNSATYKQLINIKKVAMCR